MTETLYTVARSDGDARQINLTVAEAADAILSHDGARWEIRRVDIENEIDDAVSLFDHFALWSKDLNGQWVRTVISSSVEDEAEATAEIMQAVVDQSWSWRGGLHAETMQSYQESLVE